MTATLTKWYEEHGRHEIFAGGKHVDMHSTEHSLVLDPEAVAAGSRPIWTSGASPRTRGRRRSRRAIR